MVDIPVIDRAKLVDIDLYGAVKRSPGRCFVDLAQRSPFYIEAGGVPQAVVSRHEDVKIVLSEPARFSSRKRPWGGTGGFYYYNSLPVVTDNDPPDHANLRRLMAPAFSPRKLASVEAGVRSFVATQLDALQREGRPFDLVADYAHPLSVHVLFELLFGFPEGEWSIFTRLSDAQKAAFSTLDPGPEHVAEYEAAWEAARSYCADLIEKRRAAPGEDLASAIIAAHDVEGRITTEQLFATLMVLYSAGIGGIINYTAWTLYLLCRHPDQRDLLLGDPSLVEGAIVESLRMSPSVYTALRYATGDFDFEGLHLFEGMPIHVICSAPGYDPGRFENPLRFDIRRNIDSRDMMAFGYGIHHCIGASLARMTARISVQAAIERFPGLLLSDPGVEPDIVGVPKERGPREIFVRPM
ncbi:cytochrome P450 [Rhizorhabdus dicambivorans]|nr:cytochrome P450 [Rhizorhabdus dicambivorans]